MLVETEVRCEQIDLHKGSETMTCMATWGGGLTVLLGLAMKPEFIPPARGSQGFAKEDCVAVWFWLMKVKTTMSPTAALI